MVFSKVHLSLLPENVKDAALLGPPAGYKIPECLKVYRKGESFHFFLCYLMMLYEANRFFIVRCKDDV
jgi:hypothetical protein